MSLQLHNYLMLGAEPAAVGIIFVVMFVGLLVGMAVKGGLGRAALAVGLLLLVVAGLFLLVAIERPSRVVVPPPGHLVHRSEVFVDPSTSHGSTMMMSAGAGERAEAPVSEAAGEFSTPIETAPDFNMGITLILLPALAVLAVMGLLALMRRPRREGAGSGVLWLNLGIAALVMVGFIFFGTHRVRHVPATATEVYDHVVDGVEISPDRALIDEQWERLTGPRINLDSYGTTEPENSTRTPTAPPAPAPTAEQQLNEAAEVLQAASKRMAEASAEGWLLTLARAVLNAPPKNDAEAMAHEKAMMKMAAVKAQAASTMAKELEVASEQLNESTPARRPKPDWVTRPPGIVGNVRQVVVSAGPYESLDECYQELEKRMRVAVADRITDLASDETGYRVYPVQLEWLRIGTETVMREFCNGEYDETVDSSVGPMKRAYALLEFTPAKDQWLVDRWKDFARKDRLAMVALVAGLAVGGVASVYGLLKVDTWTRGYYTKRLFIGVPAAIIAVIWLVSLA